MGEAEGVAAAVWMDDGEAATTHVVSARVAVPAAPVASVATARAVGVAWGAATAEAGTAAGTMAWLRSESTLPVRVESKAVARVVGAAEGTAAELVAEAVLVASKVGVVEGAEWAAGIPHTATGRHAGVGWHWVRTAARAGCGRAGSWRNAYRVGIMDVHGRLGRRSRRPLGAVSSIGAAPTKGQAAHLHRPQFASKLLAHQSRQVVWSVSCAVVLMQATVGASGVECHAFTGAAEAGAILWSSPRAQ